MNQTEQHEAQHENIINEFDHIAGLLHDKEECDADLLKRVEKLEAAAATKVVIAVRRSTRWKALAISLILGVCFFVGVLVADVAGGF
jgi:hypothetical protein